MTTSTSSTSVSTPDAVPAAARLGRLAGVTVGVPEPDRTAEFLGAGLGFALHATDDGWLALCEGDYGTRGQAAIELRPCPATELLRATFEVAEGYDLEALAGRLAAAGLASSPTPAGGLAFTDPAGNPLACEPAVAVARPGFSPLRPRRLGHMNLKAPDPPAAAAFYAAVLGLRLSEQIGDALFFLRIAAEHHNVGLRPGDGGALHHLGFEIAGWHAYQPLLDHLDTLDVKVEYGPGRHGPGRNLFAYVCDPSSGLRIELFADMAQIADETAYEPVRWEAGDRMTKTINRWGPTPPASFLA
jgi:catechol 2,3-dioxygenase-like lactoylglutathione lyase family enzyme